MPNLKRRVSNFSCFEARNGGLARKKHVFGVVLATRKRNRKSQPALCDLFPGGPAPQIWSAGSEIKTLENRFVKNHFLINISN